MESAIALLLVLVFVGAVLLVRGKSRRVVRRIYAPRGPLFTPAERSFFGVLSQANEGTFQIMGKVRVADVLAPRKDLSRSDWLSAFNRIKAKHFDFVLCDPTTLRVACVVELHDRSHKNSKRAARDDFLREACNAAGLPILEFKARRSYSLAEIRSRLQQVINGPPDPI